MAGERLTRDVDNAMLGGVLSGLGRHFNVDPTLLRVGAVILSIPTGGITIPAYLAAWLIIPRPDQVESGSARARVPPRNEAMDDLGQTARRTSERLAEAARTAAEAA
ncbi:MAG: PspC domain-containing protein, partial [Dehalococcoidia bacterium]|nr:PspC domain-containing protein [Dehalococcoidia bacterium]